MKKCPGCGWSHPDSTVKCPTCGTLWAQNDPPKGTGMKQCLQCGYINPEYVVTCRGCHNSLENAQMVDAEEGPSAILDMRDPSLPASDPAAQRVSGSPRLADDAIIRLLTDQLDAQKSIKSMLAFFTILVVISLVISLIASIGTASLFRP